MVHVGLDDFYVCGILGEGAVGKVLLATKKDTQRLYSMKVISKESLLTSGASAVVQVLAEKRVLQEMATRPHPFVVSLRYAFQTAESLCLLMDFVGGGDQGHTWCTPTPCTFHC